jgi:hypothetical protein
MGALEALNGSVEGIVVDPNSLNPAFKVNPDPDLDPGF